MEIKDTVFLKAAYEVVAQGMNQGREYVDLFEIETYIIKKAQTLTREEFAEWVLKEDA